MIIENNGLEQWKARLNSPPWTMCRMRINWISCAIQIFSSLSWWHICSACRPRDQLIPSSFWCNCWENLSSSPISTSYSVYYCIFSTVSSICLDHRFSASCKHLLLSAPHKFFYAIISAFVILKLYFLRTDTGDLCALMEGEKCSGFIALQAGCLTSCTTAPAFFLLSLCQREGCYGCSTAKNRFFLSTIIRKCHLTTTNGLQQVKLRTAFLHTLLVFVCKKSM